MLYVLGALVPGVVVTCVCFGFGIIGHLLVASLSAVAAEALLARVRGLRVDRTMADGSVLVLAVLVGIAIPPGAPLFVTVVATLTAVILGKQVYGGIGGNLFNPAMVGIAFVLVCFPLEMNQWPAQLNANATDGVSGATLLETARTEFSLQRLRTEFIQSAPTGWIASRGWEWVSFAYLLGGIALILTRIISWRIPATVLAGLFVAASIGFALDSSRSLPPLMHLVAGSAIVGAFFVATDPVTSPVTRRAQCVYGFALGVVIYLVRSVGAYPDGVAFAVLILNASAPWLDGITQPYSRDIELR